MFKLRMLLAALLVSGVLGCSNIGYYSQAINGQYEIYRKTQPIDTVLADPSTEAALKQKLRAVLEIRRFASAELKLPDNDSYRAYADIERPFALWNVFATPEFSLKPKEWCFMVAGCAAYRGYFAQTDAHAFAQTLRTNGYDVHVGGVPAYSTLGWFSDPLLNTVIHRPLVEIAGLIFHELAHQQLYVKGDTGFNESFAVAIELEGVRRWLQRHGSPDDYERYAARIKRREDFVALALKYRDRLDALYSSDITNDEKRDAKRQAFVDMRAEYQQIKMERWAGFEGYDAWFAQDLNNSHLLSLGLYHQHLPALQALLHQKNNDLTAFYAAARGIGQLPHIERTAALNTLLPIASADAPIY